MLVYIASSLHNIDRVRAFQKRFTDAGHRISYDWTTHGQVFTPEELRRYGEAEKKGVVDCDLLFFLQPARFGSHVELGIALAHGKPIVLLTECQVEEKTFYHLPEVSRFSDEHSAFEFALNTLRFIEHDNPNQAGN